MGAEAILPVDGANAAFVGEKLERCARAKKALTRRANHRHIFIIARIKKPAPGNWVLFFSRGVCHEQAKAWDKAEPDFRQALALNPGQPQVLNYLGYSFVDRGENLTEVGNVFGSEMRMHGSGWTVITPSHTLEAVFLYRHQGGWGVSNSLAFLLEHHRVELPWDPLYGAKFASACLRVPPRASASALTRNSSSARRMAKSFVSSMIMLN